MTERTLPDEPTPPPPDFHYPHSDSDSDDDRILKQASDSLELAEHDRELLREEEERETLLAGSGTVEKKSFFGRKGKERNAGANRDGRKSRREYRKARRRREDATHDEGELMYEMEEGGPGSEISSQASASSTELDKLKLKLDLSKSHKRQIRTHFSVSIAIIVLFLLLVFGAYQVSKSSRNRKNIPASLSNGTMIFAPTTILISLDGFRADFLRRGLTPTLNSFIAEGVSPKYMLPSFPSVTFPNHYTLVTGLHPESHGIVGNSFWDPHMKEDFFYTDPSRSMQPKWWSDGEPLWVTAEKQNVTAAVHMWPGSEAHISLLEPTFLDKFNGTEDLSRKVDRVLELIDTPGVESGPAVATRPQFIAAYVPVVDADGHTYGPNSTEIRGTIKNVDTMLHNLFTGLDQRNLTKVVNIVVVSDHGMATTSTDRLIQLDDIVDLNLVDRIDGWPLYGLRPKNSSDVATLYDHLLAEANQNPNFDVYLRETMPDRYHFSHNDRIAPLWVIPKTGWAIVHKEDFDVKEAKAKGEVYHPKGLHGYDHEHPLMRSIFVARGPAFPHKPNSRLDVFQNIEVYNIICDSLGIEPKLNNGTLRLPLRPIGLHSDQAPSETDVPVDLPSDAEASASAAAATAPQTAHFTGPSSASPSTAAATSSSSNTTANAQSDTKSESSTGLWAFVKGKLEEAKDWLSSKFGGESETR